MAAAPPTPPMAVPAAAVARAQRPTPGRCVEICGGQVDILRAAPVAGRWKLGGCSRTPRRHLHRDGRKFFLSAEERFDLLNVDVVRPQSVFSGNLYSVEFYELLRSRLPAGGLVSQWIPTGRTLNSVSEVFPQVLRFPVVTYKGSNFSWPARRPCPSTATPS